MILYGNTGYKLFEPIVAGEELEKLLYNAARILRSRKYHSAAGLIENYPFEIINATNDFGDDFNVLYAEVQLEDYEELRRISEDEEGQYALHNIATVLTEIGPYIRVIACALVKEAPDRAWRGSKDINNETQDKDQVQQSIDELIDDITQQRDLMIDVATGGARIQNVNRQYEERQNRIKLRLVKLGMEGQNQYPSLWKWYERWKKGDLPSWQDRRRFICDMYDPMIEKIRNIHIEIAQTQPTGWTRVDRGIFNIKKRLYNAAAEEEFQAIGLLCREVIISLAQAVYDPAVHVVTGQVKPSDTDANRMLEVYISHELTGSANEEARRFCKASLTLALALQHKRTAGFRDAALCVEATENLVSAVAIVAGRRQQ
jgi:hypothetical protein